jgi:anaphase-promoting complex subunit 6
LKEFELALELLNFDELNNFEKLSSCTTFENASTFTLNDRNIESSINLLRGQIHEAQGCSDAAIECYKKALHDDVSCYEALHPLTTNHMLTPKDENDLIQTLPLSSQCSPKEVQLVKYFYASKLRRPTKHIATFQNNEECKQTFKDNLDILTAKAERLYYDGDFENAYTVCRKILEKDQFHKLCVPLYVSTLVHLNKITQLFEIAHSLVRQYPQEAISWFAVGCYYLKLGNMDPARKFFLKATCLNRSFSPAWLALGHSFAQESEHDQATSAYFTAAQIMKGSFLPYLYIGLEYTLSNNLKLAERFYQQALVVECDDPFVLHELGVIWFKSQNYSNAEISMRRAYNKLKTLPNRNTFKEWEPLLNNLGHVCRKLK